jgi:predicted dehydrogenase
MDKIKVGVVGVGYWGPKLARNFHQCPGAELRWACDLRLDRLQHVSHLYPAVRLTQDYAELLRSYVDAVCVATPVSTHYPLALAALKAGKHVLVEKPLAASLAEAEEIVAEGRKRGLTVMVGHTFVYNPAVVAMQHIIARHYLGDVYYVDAARVNLGLFQPDINVVWDLAPHDISILIYVLGMEPESVSARGGIFVQRQKGLHDVAYLAFYFPNGLLAQVRVSWLDPCKIRRYTVVGSERMLVYDDVDPQNKLSIYDRGVDMPPYSDTEEEFHLSYRTGAATPYPIEWVEPLRVECEHFVDCIRHGTEPRSGGEAGLQVVRVLEAAQRSLLNDGHLEAVR